MLSVLWSRASRKESPSGAERNRNNWVHLKKQLGVSNAILQYGALRIFPVHLETRRLHHLVENVEKWGENDVVSQPPKPFSPFNIYFLKQEKNTKFLNFPYLAITFLDRKNWNKKYNIILLNFFNCFMKILLLAIKFI